MGREMTTPSRRRTIGSGDAPTTVTSGKRRKYRYGLGIDQAQDPVDVEGVGPERRGRSAGTARPGRCRRPGCAPWPPRWRPCTARRSWCARSTSSGGGRRGRQQSAGLGRRGRTQSAASSSQPRRSAAAWAASSSPSRPRRVDHHVVDQDDALAPVVEGGQNWPITTRTASGWPRSSGGGVRQALDLADHVVAEVADQPAVQRRQVRAGRASRRRQDAPRAPPGRRRPVTPPPRARRGRGRPGWSTVRPLGDQRGERAAADERVAAPALAALDGLEQEAAGVPGPPRSGEGADRGQGVGHQLAPDRARCGAPWPARRTRQARVGRPGPSRARSPGVGRHPGPVAEGPVEAGPAARCGRRPRPPGPRHQQARRRRSRSGPRARTGGRPRSRPCTSTPGGCGSRTTCARSRASGAATRRSSRRTSAPCRRRRPGRWRRTRPSAL